MFVLKGKIVAISLAIILVFSAFVVCFSALGTKRTNGNNSNKITVLLDAGHGGVDGGVSGVNTGISESKLNLSVVKKLENFFLVAGMDVVLTRSSDAGLYGVATKNRKKKDMQKRKEIIYNADPTIVISIHMNKYSLQQRRGAQVFFKSGDQLGKMLADQVQKSLNEMPSSVRSYDALKGDYYILNCSNYPSIICECGFLSNPDDEALLISEEYQEKIAYAIFKGAISYLSEASFKFCD